MRFTSAPGASLGIFLLAFLKNASSIPGPTGRAKTSLDSEESCSLSYSERVTLAAGELDGETQGKNKCNPLASPCYTSSCTVKQTLDLEKPEECNHGRHFPVKPKCAERPCEDQMEDSDYHKPYRHGPSISNGVPVFDVASLLGKCDPVLRHNESKFWSTDEKQATPTVPAAVFGPVEGNEQSDGVTRKLNGAATFSQWRSSDVCEPSKNNKINLFRDNESHLPKKFTVCGDSVTPIRICQYFDPTTRECLGKVKVGLGPLNETYIKANVGPFD